MVLFWERQKGLNPKFNTDCETGIIEACHMYVYRITPLATEVAQ